MSALLRVGPLAVFGVALMARAVTAAGISFPIPEDSAYYVAAAQNLAAGRGLVVDVLWSYATPPLAVPRAAFDLWQPLASLLAAPVMVISGPSPAAAQATGVLIGSIVAPLTWAIARRAAGELGLPPARTGVVAFTAGLLVALAPLLVLQSAELDSSAPFTVLTLTACWLIPGALDERPPAIRARVFLGLVIGLAYLARQDAIFVALAYVLVAAVAGRSEAGGPMARVLRTLPAFAAAILLVTPWLVRQALTWTASPFGQTLENAWSVRQTDIFAWSDRPTLASHLALGLPGLAALRIDALLGAIGLLFIAAFPGAVLGVAALWGRRRLVALPSLRPLAIAGAAVLAVDVLVFPVAGRAGLWAHGAGSTVALLAILAALGLDALVARVGALRGWRPITDPLAPILLLPPLVALALTLPLMALAGALEHERANVTGAQYEALAASAAQWGLDAGHPVVTDHPMWLTAALGGTAIALPRERPSAIVELARRFGAVALVARDPDAIEVLGGLAGYRTPQGAACFEELPTPPPFRALAFTCASEFAWVITGSPDMRWGGGGTSYTGREARRSSLEAGP